MRVKVRRLNPEPRRGEVHYRYTCNSCGAVNTFDRKMSVDQLHFVFIHFNRGCKGVLKDLISFSGQFKAHYSDGCKAIRKIEVS